MPETYKAMLADMLRVTRGREVYTAIEVQNDLLDLWNALNADFPTDTNPLAAAEEVVPVPA